MESGFIAVPGGRLYYEADGAGHPLLLIPGGLGSLRMWDEHVPAFVKRYQVIRFDPRGYGDTETDNVEFSNRADAAAVLEQLGAQSAHVVGQSRGGNIGLDLSIERPELVDALVLVAAGASGYEPQLPAGVEPVPWDEMERLWESKDWTALAELETRVWVDGWGQPATRVDAELRRRVHDEILQTYLAQKEEAQPQPLQPPAAGRLGEVEAPLLVVIGSVDEPGGTLNSRFVAESVAGARLVEFEGAAHMVHMEQPARFNELVLEFLAEVDATHGR